MQESNAWKNVCEHENKHHEAFKLLRKLFIVATV